MAKNQTYKAFTMRPTHILDLNGELLDSAPVMAPLRFKVFQPMPLMLPVMTRNLRLAWLRRVVSSLRRLVAAQVL